jgi:hypothetical protein
MSKTSSVVAIYETRAQAEEAVKELQRFGLDVRKMSIVGKDYHTDEHVVAYNNAGDPMKYWDGQGLYNVGIPQDTVVKYESALRSDRFLVLAYGMAGEMADAGDIIETTHPIEVAVHTTEREQRAGAAGRQVLLAAGAGDY